MSRKRHQYVPSGSGDSLRAIGARQACFSDETAIDFVSVGDLVDRVRDAFLGDTDGPGDTLTADLRLSRRDAARGTVVPFDVPLRGTCTRCGGRGETWSEPCLHCCGTGDALIHQAVHLSVPAGVADGARLRFRIRTPDAAPAWVEARIAIAG